MNITYQCEGCKNSHRYKESIFLCLSCEKEICNICFGAMAHCRKCAVVLSREEMKANWKREFGSDFEEYVPEN